MRKILFVCTGNTCRSSMAEVMFKQYLKEAQINDIMAGSAGIYATEGDRATLQAIEVMNELDLDLTGHRACRLTPELVQNANLILTMTNDQKMLIKIMEPSAMGKVYTLKEFAGYEDPDILDPFGQDVETYRRCAWDIGEALKKVIKKLNLSN
ncbi:MAG: low molecular weight protein arginine phosphatase [Xylanivirga thermophila]|uniref:low molecular weight protein arginine phosphatase n=1 Tax=Xylanivirga thermophila TaxID=2496273 RepID=UPI0039F47046